jgi:hypothetical protein
MKFKFLAPWTVLALLLGCWSTTALADDTTAIGTSKKFGIGVGGGSFTYGLSPKLFISDVDAVQGSIGMTGYGLNVGADYLRQFGTLWSGPAGRLWYGAGAGAELLMYNYAGFSDVEIGVAGVGEVGWHFRNMPLEVTGSLRPTFYIGNYFGGFYFAGGGAVRWYF